ncbi:MAG TPA: hypothetical protein VGN07_03975 [Steroidobacteraceae bacterium]
MAACSDDGDSEGPRVSPLAGFWAGSATDTTTGEVLNANAFIDESGEAHLMVTPALLPLPPGMPPTFPIFSSGPLPRSDLPTNVIIASPVNAIRAVTIFVVHGNLCCAAGFRGALNAEPIISGAKSTVQIDGSLSSGMLVGTFDFAGKPYSFSLAPTPTYAETLTMQDLAGVYTRTQVAFFGNATTVSTIAVTANGTITGTDAGGCIYNGNVVIPDTSHNMFRLNVQISNCDSTVLSLRNGEYTGFGMLVRNVATVGAATAQTQLFYYSLIGPVWLGPQGLGR